MSQVDKIGASYETGGFNVLTLRAVAAVDTRKGKRIYRGSWVDTNIEALKSLIEEMGRQIQRQVVGCRYLEERDAMQQEVESLEEVVGRYEEAGDLASLHDQLREAMRQRNRLEVEVAELKAKLIRIHAVVDELIEAVGEPPKTER